MKKFFYAGNEIEKYGEQVFSFSATKIGRFASNFSDVTTFIRVIWYGVL
jgi:hypothetical protein